MEEDPAKNAAAMRMLFYKEILWKQRDCSLISFGAESPSPIHRNISFSKIQSLFSEKRQNFLFRGKILRQQIITTRKSTTMIRRSLKTMAFLFKHQSKMEKCQK